MSGPRDWIIRTLTPSEQYQLLSIRHKRHLETIGWMVLEPVSRIAVAELINLKLVEFRRRFWLFGRPVFVLTRKGHQWAEIIDQPRGKKS